MAIMDLIRQNRFFLFLVFLLMGLANPILSKDPGILKFLSSLNYTLILISGIYAFSRNVIFMRYTGGIYFSFVTMTTPGCGDISPAINATRSLAILLSIVGPMYIAVIISLMVGKFSASRNS